MIPCTVILVALPPAHEVEVAGEWNLLESPRSPLRGLVGPKVQKPRRPAVNQPYLIQTSWIS
jgi:hypothetical protein